MFAGVAFLGSFMAKSDLALATQGIGTVILTSAGFICRLIENKVVSSTRGDKKMKEQTLFRLMFIGLCVWLFGLLGLMYLFIFVWFYMFEEAAWISFVFGFILWSLMMYAIFGDGNLKKMLRMFKEIDTSTRGDKR